MEIHCWIESALWRMYIDATKRSVSRLTEKKEVLVVSRGVLDTEGLGEDVPQPSRYQDDKTVVVDAMPSSA